MDSRNLFLTPVTYRLVRMEYLAGLLLALGLLIGHRHDVRWAEFVLLFAYIDVIGYLPGHLAWRRTRGGTLPKVYYVLYNTMHSLLTAGLVAAVWCALVRPEWALLALPIHLFGDRAVFGNFLKPFGVKFEPQTLPAYADFRRNYVDHVQHGMAPDSERAGHEPIGAR